MNKLWTILLSIASLCATQTVFAQCGPVITCPANVTVNNTTGMCGAIVNYAPATAITTCSTSTVTVYTETFQSGVGAWTLNVNTGSNAAQPNSWEVNATEGGVAPPGCGVANNGDQTLHITCTSVFCGSLITGAVYNATKLSNKRAESPVINTTGNSTLTLNFNYISLGDGLLDNCSVVYNDGTGWQTLTASIKSPVCPSGQGQWTAYTAALPASCDNNPNLQIGFNWTNNADGAGTDPSIAINDITITGQGAAPPVITYSHPTGSLFPVGTTTVTAIATDASLNADTCTFQVTVNDTELPVITCPSSMTVSANNAGCTAIVNWTVPGATDNCPAPILTSTHNPGDVFPLGTTTVMYTATDGAGNTVTCSFSVTVTNPLNVNINSTMGMLECEGHTDTLIASGASAYTWNTSSTNDTLFVVQTPGVTQWIVVGTDGNGCSDSDTVNVLVSELVVISMNMSAIDTQCVSNGTVNLTAISAPGGGTWTGPGVTGMTFDPTAAGVGTHTLTYTVPNADSCMSTATGTIYVDNCLGISAAANEQAVMLYPNPTTGNFILETETNALVEIYNSLGELVLTQSVVAGKNSLSLENCAVGIYVVKISDGDGVKMVRVVKGE